MEIVGTFLMTSWLRSRSEEWGDSNHWLMYPTVQVGLITLAKTKRILIKIKRTSNHLTNFKGKTPFYSGAMS